MKQLHTTLNALFPLGELTQQRPNLAFITVPKAHLRSVILHLRDVEGFSHLVLLTAVDWLEEGQFQLTYLVNHRGRCLDIGLRVLLPRDAASIITPMMLLPLMRRPLRVSQTSL